MVIAGDLDLLEAEAVGFDPLDLVRALPGVLKGTGQALDKRPAAAHEAPPPPPPAPPGLSLTWKVGGAVAAGALALALLRR